MPEPRKPELHREVAERLRRAGHRYTSNRRTVVEVVAAARHPLSMPQILKARRSLAQSSVYRSLSVLEEAHVVRRISTEEDFARFELAEDLSEHHHHLVCSSCGAISDVQLPTALERRMEGVLVEAASSEGFRATAHRLDVFGLCRSCA